MLMKTWKIMSVLPLAALTVLLGCGELWAQARPVGRAAQTAAAAESGREVVVISRLVSEVARTPDYAVAPSESSRQQDWVRVSTTYTTESEWIDELEFRYFVVVKHPRTGDFTMFPATVTYLDVPKGRNHVSTMFLRPNSVARYGTVERMAVEVYARGEVVAYASHPDDKTQWWRMQMNARVMDGVLLNRAQTPFAFVAWDNYQTIKGR